MKAKENSGFTLLELMIVVEIIAILAAVMVPTMMRNRIMTNESATTSNLRTISTAEVTFNTSNSKFGTFDELTAGTSNGMAYLTGAWSEGCVKNGYQYSIEEATEQTYRVRAVPISPGRSGIRTFTVDESGLIDMTG